MEPRKRTTPVSPAETTPPLSLDALENEEKDLLRQIRDIESQLGAKVKLDRSGKKLSTIEYDKWRRGAVFALRKLEHRRRQLLAQIKERRTLEAAERAAFPVLDPDDPVSILTAAYAMLRNLGAEVDFTEQEQALVDVIRSYLLNKA